MRRSWNPIISVVATLVVGAGCAVFGFLVGVTVGAEPGQPGDTARPAAGEALPSLGAADRSQRTDEQTARANAAANSTSTAEPARSRGAAGGPAKPPVDARAPVVVDTAAIAAILGKRVGADVSAERLAQAESRARSIRENSLRTADSAESAAAWQVASEIEKERAFTADAARGGTLDMLRKLDASPVRAFDLVGSRSRFDERFVRHAQGSVTDGSAPLVPPNTVRPPLTDGAIVRFPGGLHTWRASSLGRDGEFPKDVVFEGAGMDLTMVRLEGFRPSAAVDVLTFRDLTIDCGGSALIDARTEPVVLLLERCRVIGFDGDEMLSVAKGAFHAIDSRFEAGWEAPPGHGTLFDVSSVLARFDRCTFAGPFKSVFDDERGATYVFADCRFESMARGFAKVAAAPPECARFERCTVTEIETDDSSHAFDVTSLFPILFAEPPASTVVSGVGGGVVPTDVLALTVVFPAGAHKLGLSIARFQGDLVITGQGRDTTLVRVDSSLNARRVFWRDVAIDGEGSDPCPSRTAYISFERCRFVAYDTGSGGSTAVDFRSDGAVRLVDCRFDAGYGRSPTHGTALSVSRAPTRADRCVFAMQGGVAVDGSSNVVLADCTISGIDATRAAWLRSEKSGVVLLRTSIEVAPPDATRGLKPRPLSEINASWGDGRR
ncbi:MAG: hypothetical protein K8T90_19030 [Planctomycetes bacterium]|nr:hypothetical protein [Planctomycetota bacterium]